MKNILILEETATFAFSIFLFQLTPFAWWWYLALILAPDLGMLGYLVNTKVGAITYNLFHHKAIAIIVLLFGFYYSLPWIFLTGIILFGHSSLDRIFGYGLKHFDDFKHTHLGWLPSPQKK